MFECLLGWVRPTIAPYNKDSKDSPLDVKKLLTLAATVALTLAGPTACTPDPAPSSSVDRADDELVLALGDFTEAEFDPRKGWGSHNEHYVTHSSLLRWNSDEKIAPDLASGYTLEGTTLTFTLNPDYRFSTGEQVTAKDVVYTYEMLAQDGVAFDLSHLDAITAPDESTVVIELTEPDSTFVPLVTQIGIVPAASYGENYSADPVSSGPYRVVDFQRGEQVIMEANPYYPKELKYQKLTFVLSDVDAAIAATRAGEVDVTYVDAGMDLPDIAGMSTRNYPSVENLGITLPTEQPGGSGTTMGAGVATGNAVTADPAIRRALNIGLDRREIVDTVFGDDAVPASSVSDGLPWAGPEITEDPDEARRLLDDAGWSDTNGDGTVDKDGVEAVIPLLYTTTEQARVDLAATVSALSAADLGIRFDPIPSTWDDIYADGKTSAVVFALGSLSPKEVLDSYHSHSRGSGYNNMPDYANPAVDHLIDQARAEPLADSAQLWRDAQAVAAEDAPYVWLARRDHVYLVADDVDLGDQPLHGHGHGLQIFQNVEQWR